MIPVPTRRALPSPGNGQNMPGRFREYSFQSYEVKNENKSFPSLPPCRCNASKNTKKKQPAIGADRHFYCHTSLTGGWFSLTFRRTGGPAPLPWRLRLSERAAIGANVLPQPRRQVDRRCRRARRVARGRLQTARRSTSVSKYRHHRYTVDTGIVSAVDI